MIYTQSNVLTEKYSNKWPSEVNYKKKKKKFGCCASPGMFEICFFTFSHENCNKRRKTKKKDSKWGKKCFLGLHQNAGWGFYSQKKKHLHCKKLISNVYPFLVMQSLHVPLVVLIGLWHQKNNGRIILNKMLCDNKEDCQAWYQIIICRRRLWWILIFCI